MTDDKLFTPEFVYEICVGLAIHDFLTKDLPLQLVSDRYSNGLTEHYRQVSEVEISHPAEEILRFLSEQKNPQYEAHEKANFFIYNRLKFDGIKGERKLKGIFGNAYTGDKKKNILLKKQSKILKRLFLQLEQGLLIRLL